MGELIESFLQIAEDDEQNLSVEELLTEEERIEWETLVKALDNIDILHVGNDLKKITKIYQLQRWQEMAILAYVKILELMMKRAKDSGAMDMVEDLKNQSPESTDYKGGMFG